MPFRILIMVCFASLAISCEAQKPVFKNQLANETSPYLLQHANNPVDWNPWGEEALQKAKKENKLIVISVGYAACHWCHVMEHESFEDTTVARIMNENFVSIKVDREERPDIDAIYMDACQLASGGACGWPLNVFALPDGRPVWAGTYFPKKNWIQMLDYFIKLYAESPEKLDEYATKLTEGIQLQSDLEPLMEGTLEFDLSALQEPIAGFLGILDPQLGGQRGAPKFPMPNAQELLLSWNYFTDDDEALALLKTTLDKMAQGGIYDHLGGGFARYATDDQWRVPHFEKMLYDNAQLVSLYAKAYAATGSENYKRIVEETLSFVERELKDENGGFYSSLDADSEGEEGKFYVWKKSELEAVLKKEPLFDQFLEYYQIKDEGNWEDEKNIFYTTASMETFAKSQNLELASLKGAFYDMRMKLFTKRSQRIRPGLDNKILTSWNALMLQAYIDAYRYLGDEHYLEIARENASFLLEYMQKEDNSLFRTYNKNQAKINAFLDDYAALAMAFANLYEATFEEQWLLEADKLIDYANVHFYNREKSLYNYTSDLDPPLVARKFELIDKAIPSSNSMIARSLFKVGTLIYQESYLERSTKMFNQIASQALSPEQASFFSNWLQLYLAMSKTPYEVAIVGSDYQQLKKSFLADFRPDAFFLGGAKEGNLDLLQSKLQEGETYIYVCQNKVCQFPVQEVEAARKQMK